MRSSIIFFALLALATAWPRHDMQQNQQEELLRNVLQYFNDAEIEGENPSEPSNLEIQEDSMEYARQQVAQSDPPSFMEQIALRQQEELLATEMEIEKTDTSNGEQEQEPDDSLASLKEQMAKLMYQNQWDKVLNYKCPTGSAFYRVQSVHNNGREDRLWEFTCKKVDPNQCQQPRCTTSSYINNFRDYISFMCGRNQYMAGVYSYHDNGKEDRRWRFTCCSLPSYITRECYLTGYVNSYDGKMNFNAGGNGLITGVVSEYSTGHRDRRWKFAVCRYVYS